jgi:hypothetical protein
VSETQRRTIKRVPIWKFRLGDVFNADDPLSVWICVLAVAFNDAVHANVKTDKAPLAWARIYEWRVAISHFSEACLHLERGREVDEVIEFLASEPDIKEMFDDVLVRYDNVRHLTNRIRNEAAFHYPYRSGHRAVARALTNLADEEGTFGGEASTKIKDSRQFYADALAARLVMNAMGGTERAYEEAATELGEAVAAFGRFANAALDAYFVRHKDALRPERRTESKASDRE